MKEEKYDFIEDVFTTITDKWKTLDTKEDIEEDEEEMYDGDVRQSSVYLMEFLDILSTIIDFEEFDVSYFVHTFQYIVKNFDYMEELIENIHETLGSDYLHIVNGENIEDFNMDDLNKRAEMIGETGFKYIRDYIEKNNIAVQYLLDSIMLVRSIVFVTIHILLHLELEYFRM